MLGCFKVGGFGKDGLECWRLFFGEGFLVVGSFGALGVSCFGGGCSEEQLASVDHEARRAECAGHCW